MEMTFGSIIQSHRRKKGWTVKTFIEQLGKDVSPAYITKIEVHGEIPSPELICKIAETLNIEYQYLFDAAKNQKVKFFSETLEKKYQRAEGFYRLQRKNHEL